MKIPIKTSYTREDYEKLPEGGPYQLIGGQLLVSPSPSPHHQIISAKLLRILANFVEEHGSGIVFHAPSDVRFTETDIVQPDLYFIRAAREHIIGEHYIEGPPDLLIEILSRGTAYQDLKKKKDLYERNKVPEYWIVDPTDKTVDVYLLEGNAYDKPIRLDAKNSVSATHIEGFTMPVEEIFKR